MGDVIHAMPVLEDIHRHNPAILIDWMVEAPFADLVRANYRVNEIIPVNLRQWRKKGVRELWFQWKRLREQLSDRHYDLVLDLQGLIKSALLACAARGERAGPGLGYAKEGLACLFYKHRAGWDPQAHAVERLRELCAELLRYRLQGPPLFYNALPKQTVGPEASCREIWFLHATAREEKKWPIVRWRELAHRFTDMGYQVHLPWGSDEERQAAESIAKNIEGVVVLPKMSLKLLSDQIQKARLVIGVDTGLTHLAAAHYLPMVALFFATPAWRFAPRFNPRSISIGDVGREPSVGEVYEAGSRLLRGNRV